MSLLSALQGAGPSSFGTVRATVGVMGGRRCGTEGRPSRLLVGSIGAGLARLRRRRLVGGRYTTKCSGLSSFAHSMVGGTMGIGPVILRPSGAFFSGSSSLASCVKAVTRRVRSNGTLGGSRAASALMILRKLLERFRAAERLLIGDFARRTTCRITERRLAARRLLMLLRRGRYRCSLWEAESGE